MGSSPDSLNRDVAATSHTVKPQDTTREAPRTIEELRTDVLTRIKTQRTRDANPTATTQRHKAPHTTYQTVEYTGDDTVESYPSNPHHRSTPAHDESSSGRSVAIQPTPNPWAAGELIANRYRLLEPLGAGAWGTIWKARQEGIGRFVAIKILKDREPQSMTNARSRFEREAKLASRVRHPSAVRILDFGYRNNQPYLVMEWLQGLTLQSFLRECGPLPPELVVDIGIGICGALHAAHQEGVIHRDLKPSNIMLVETSNGLTPVVVDFGLARTFAPDEPTVTRDDMIVGTPAYMCPESIRGRRLTPTSDIYSLGVTFLTALLGENPFRGESGSVTMTNHLLERPVDKETLELIGCSSALASALLAMIAIEPEDRPTARVLEHHFQQLLDDFIRGEVPDTHPAANLTDWSDEAESWSLETSDFREVGALSNAPPAHPSAQPSQAPETGMHSSLPDDDTAVTPEVIKASASAAPHTQSTPLFSVSALFRRKMPAIMLSLLLIALLGAVLTQQGRWNGEPDAGVDATTPSVGKISAENAFMDSVSGGLAVTAPPATLEDADTAATAALVSLSGAGQDGSHPNRPRDPTASRALDENPQEEEFSRLASNAADGRSDQQTPKISKHAPVVDNQVPLKAVPSERPPPQDVPSENSAKSAAPEDSLPDNPKSVARASAPRSASRRTKPADLEPATLVLTLSPPGEVHIGDTSYGLRSSLLLDQIRSGRHTIRVKRGDAHEERRVRLKPGERHVESF